MDVQIKAEEAVRSYFLPSFIHGCGDLKKLMINLDLLDKHFDTDKSRSQYTVVNDKGEHFIKEEVFNEIYLIQTGIGQLIQEIRTFAEKELIEPGSTTRPNWSAIKAVQSFGYNILTGQKDADGYLFATIVGKRFHLNYG